MAIFSGKVQLASGDIIPASEYIIRDLLISGSRSDYVAALAELRRGEVDSRAAVTNYETARINRFPTLTEVVRQSQGVRMHAIDMLEELLSVWPEEVA